MPDSAVPAVASGFDRLPGWEIVSVGLEDLAERRISVESLLVQSVSIRLGELGIVLPRSTIADPNSAVYALLAADVGEGRAHSRYNALRRRLAKFLRAASAVRASSDAPPD